jgi:predicted alpha/beta-hydrolase family hydrolase
MEHEFMRRMASALASRGVSVLRFNFPYMEVGRRVPDRQAALVQTISAAVEVAADQIGDLPVFAGGKSMGGRMASIAQAERPLSGVKGLVFLGYPLHAAGRPGIDRARHLSDIHVPFLFVQGSRDRLADMGLMRSVVRERLADRATLLEIPDGDHSLRVPKRSGRTYGEVLEEAAGWICDWMSRISEFSR